MWIDAIRKDMVAQISNSHGSRLTRSMRGAPVLLWYELLYNCKSMRKTITVKVCTKLL